MIKTIKNLLGIEATPDFKALITAGAVIVDVRSPGEFKSGHAKGAVNVPLDKIGEYAQKQKNKEQLMITCCASGMRSASARSALRNAGFTNVYNGGPWQNVNF